MTAPARGADELERQLKLYGGAIDHDLLESELPRLLARVKELEGALKVARPHVALSRVADDLALVDAAISKTETQPANARLIAAAPELLEALRDLIRIRDWCIAAGGEEGPLSRDVIRKFAEMQIPAVDAARAAIAKATGGQP